MSLDLKPCVRAALIAEPSVAGLLSEWVGEPSVHTILPLPADATGRIARIAQMVPGDADKLVARTAIVVVDVFLYGDNPADYRDVDLCGYNVRELFHRQRGSITPPAGTRIVEIIARGPMPAPTDDETRVGRLVTLTIKLQEV